MKMNNTNLKEYIESLDSESFLVYGLNRSVWITFVPVYSTIVIEDNEDGE